METCYTSKPRVSYKLWRAYSRYMEHAMQPRLQTQYIEAEHLSNRLFTHAIVYGLPVGFLALIPTVYITLKQGQTFLALFGAFIMFTVAAIAVMPQIPMALRKSGVSAALIITAIVLTAFVGTWGIGCIYLLTFSVFYALHFAGKLARRALWINVGVCLLFTVVILLKLVNTRALSAISLADWISYSVNFIFLNIVIVLMIRQTIARLERAMRKEAEIHQKLKKEFQENQALQESLRESENKYRTLFSMSPSAKLIFDTDTLQFLETNKAASEIYGYSDADFLELKLTDIHSSNDLPILLKHLEFDLQNDGMLSPIIARHLRKDGSIVHVEIMRSNIDFKGKAARLIVINDITQQIEQLNAIQKQNAKLREIVYIQSHLVRLPLTKIMALTDLIADEFKTGGDPQLLNALTQSSNELDGLIRKIVEDSSSILNEYEG